MNKQVLSERVSKWRNMYLDDDSDGEEGKEKKPRSYKKREEEEEL